MTLTLTHLSLLSLSLSPLLLHIYLSEHMYILVDQPTSPIRVGIHSGIYLNCLFFSNPPPMRVQWKKGVTSFLSGDEFWIFMNNGTLHVLRFETTGRYTVNFICTIGNEYGYDSRIFSLLVQGEWVDSVHVYTTCHMMWVNQCKCKHWSWFTSDSHVALIIELCLAAITLSFQSLFRLHYAFQIFLLPLPILTLKNILMTLMPSL